MLATPKARALTGVFDRTVERAGELCARAEHARRTSLRARARAVMTRHKARAGRTDLRALLHLAGRSLPPMR